VVGCSVLRGHRLAFLVAKEMAISSVNPIKALLYSQVLDDMIARFESSLC
jgi:hypothetical protein